MKITSKELKNDYYYIISFGYCDIYYLEKELHKIGYNSGIYGWNYSAFALTNNIAIVTGYRPITSQNINKEKEVKELILNTNKKIKDIKCDIIYYDKKIEKDIEKEVKKLIDKIEKILY